MGPVSSWWRFWERGDQGGLIQSAMAQLQTASTCELLQSPRHISREPQVTSKYVRAPVFVIRFKVCQPVHIQCYILPVARQAVLASGNRGC